MDTGESAKRAVRVTIFKQAYTVRTTGDVAETEALAAGVDELMNRIADRDVYKRQISIRRARRRFCTCPSRRQKAESNRKPLGVKFFKEKKRAES